MLKNLKKGEVRKVDKKECIEILKSLRASEIPSALKMPLTKVIEFLEDELTGGDEGG